MAGGDDINDGELFRKEMNSQGVKETRRPGNQIPNPQQRPKPTANPTQRRRKQALVENKTSDNPASLTTAVDQSLPGEPVVFIRQGISKTKVRAFRRGQISLDETIDLHGMREPEAIRALTRFLDESRLYQWQCIQIVHGKGSNSEQPGGVLRPMTIHWLKRQPEVLSFCSADYRDGGTGATNVLLAG